MPRKARTISITGYFHVIVRGIGKQILFEENKDYGYYVSLLRKYAVETGVTICAYCLMDNHVHLLLNDVKGDLALFMKKMGVSYAIYFNKKYERTGHLFQDRFISEAVEDEGYLLTVFRYILNNPYAAGICPASEYLWSSYGRYEDPESFVDTTLLRQMIGNWEQYAEFIAEKNDDQCMEYFPVKKDDEWAKAKIHKVLGIESGTELQAYARSRRDEALRMLKKEGLTVRQIERMTGISHSVIQRA